MWKRAEPFTGDLTKELTDVTIFSGYTEYATTDIYAAPSYSMIETSYMLSRSTPITTGVVSSILQNVADYNYLQGNYVVANGDCRSFSANNATGLYFIPPDAKVTVVDRVILVASKAIHIWGYGDHERIDYVNSPDQNGYPPAVDDGYTYTALGQLGNKVQIATGSYKGTGTYGASNKNSLTFDFEPKVVFISKKSGQSQITPAVYLWGASHFESFSAVNDAHVYNSVTISGKTMSWYGQYQATNQYNASGTYMYIAIG